MESVEIGEKLSKTLKDLADFETNKLLLWSTIYTRKAEMLKQEKTKELKEYLEGQVKFYKRDLNKYQSRIDELTEKYESKISRIIEIYNALYIYLQNEVVFAQNNQKIAIANLIVSKRGWVKAKVDNNEALVEKSNKKVFATAQKKLNYDVVIDECNARLEKCMKDAIDSINELFTISNTKISTTNNGFMDKIKQFINITFMGEKSFNSYVLEPLNITLKDLEFKTVSKISDVKTEMLIFISQMERIRKDINFSFNETLNKN